MIKLFEVKFQYEPVTRKSMFEEYFFEVEGIKIWGGFEKQLHQLILPNAKKLQEIGSFETISEAIKQFENCYIPDQLAGQHPNLTGLFGKKRKKSVLYRLYGHRIDDLVYQDLDHFVFRTEEQLRSTFQNLNQLIAY